MNLLNFTGRLIRLLRPSGQPPLTLPAQGSLSPGGESVTIDLLDGVSVIRPPYYASVPAILDLPDSGHLLVAPEVGPLVKKHRPGQRVFSVDAFSIAPLPGEPPRAAYAQLIEWPERLPL